MSREMESGEKTKLVPSDVVSRSNPDSFPRLSSLEILKLEARNWVQSLRAMGGYRANADLIRRLLIALEGLEGQRVEALERVADAAKKLRWANGQGGWDIDIKYTRNLDEALAQLSEVEAESA